ncbi:hypothetical protein RFI_23440 [Reticulomyxa filosa]|uniref:Uncharacterized protein n=1 Tax=Reticulomyxa filosa TaxID=46433 RepID=X6MKG6_RETFI|nr:hypothetical protein RFI_23440 [Reticulomyxa filosa]|eukprot:ETO13927.1 hypothetical protein RFI_23440 [Reticulomyxa filosa]
MSSFFHFTNDLVLNPFLILTSVSKKNGLLTSYYFNTQDADNAGGSDCFVDMQDKDVTFTQKSSGGASKSSPAGEKKSVKFFSPVKSSKTQNRSNGSSLDKKLLEKAIQRFRSLYKREPTREERENLSKFLTSNLPSIEPENAGDTENKNPNIKKMDLDSEDDSDYAPEKDYTCNAEKDQMEEAEDLMNLANDYDNEMMDLN